MLLQKQDQDPPQLLLWLRTRGQSAQPGTVGRICRDLNRLVISDENFSSEYNKPLQFQMPTHRNSMNWVPPAALASTSLCRSAGTKLLSQPISRSSPSIKINYFSRACGSAVSSPLTRQPWEQDLLPITR